MLMFDIIRTKAASDRITDFVAIGNLIDGGANSYHAAFIIQHDDSLYEFHFTGETVEYNINQRDYYHKITDTILDKEVPAFIAHCKNVLKKAKPIYGFYYSGEFYNQDGTFVNISNPGQIMTCVGFCLSVLKGFIEEDYLSYSDWPENSEETRQYIRLFCERTHRDESSIAASQRVINPRECLTSCFFSAVPITREMILSKKVEVDEFFKALVN